MNKQENEIKLLKHELRNYKLKNEKLQSKVNDLSNKNLALEQYVEKINKMECTQ